MHIKIITLLLYYEQAKWLALFYSACHFFAYFVSHLLTCLLTLTFAYKYTTMLILGGTASPVATRRAILVVRVDYPISSTHPDSVTSMTLSLLSMCEKKGLPQYF